MFLLFGGDDYYAGGGMADFRGRFETLESAEQAARAEVFQNSWSHASTCQWWQIVESESLKIVQSNQEDWQDELNEHIQKHLS